MILKPIFRSIEIHMLRFLILKILASLVTLPLFKVGVFYAHIYIHTFDMPIRSRKISFFVVNTHTYTTNTQFLSQRQFSLKFDNYGWFRHTLATCDIIWVEIPFQRHYIFIIPIYNPVISDKCHMPSSIVTTQIKRHPVTFFSYRSVVIYIVVMR